MKTILLHPQGFRHSDTGIPGSVKSRARTFKLQTVLSPGKINIDSRKFLATYVVTYLVKLVAKWFEFDMLCKPSICGKNVILCFNGVELYPVLV